MKFSEWLATKMKERGETKYKLAKALHISQSTPANWLADDSKPNGCHRYLLSKHYGVPMEEIPGKEV